MAQNKLNTLHIHLTDGEAFAINTEKWLAFSDLSVKGAFAPSLRYEECDERENERERERERLNPPC